MYADTERMRNAAEEIRNAAGKYAASRQELDALMKSLSTAWKDDASTKLTEKYEKTTRINLEHLQDLLEKFSTALIDTAGEYDSAVNKINNNI